MRGKPRFVTRVTALRQYVLSEQAELKADGFCHAADVPRRIPHESVFDFVDVGDHAHDSLGSARRMSPIPQPGAVIDVSMLINRVPSGRSSSSQR
jgi:hypothetical protein